MAFDPLYAAHLARSPLPISLWRSSQIENNFLDFAGVGYTKSPYYPFGEDLNAPPQASRQAFVDYLSMKSDARENLVAKGRKARMPLVGSNRTPIVFHPVELARRGAQMNTTILQQNPNYYAYGPVDSYNPLGAPSYASARQLGHAPLGRQPFA